MELKKLHKDLISKLRSTFTINTFTQCIMELVYNSLDASSTAVAIRINFVAYRIQIVDNGDGISKDNMLQLGNRYMTSKCEGLQDFQKPAKYYGYRGEALASIMECSKSVNVTSRHKNTSETYSKTLQKNGNEQVSLIKTRPSSGTTVTVEGFFYNLAVRRNRIVPELELEDLKTFIQHIIMMHPNVSFTIRDDVSSELFFNSQKHKDILAAFKYFHPEVDCDFSLLKVSRKKLTVEALLFKDLYGNKNAQYIFVNKRPIHSAKIQKYIVSMISKNRKHVRQKIENLNKVYPVYIVNIKCPHALVSYNNDQTKTTVEFADWSLVFRYIEKLVYSFFGNEEKLRDERRSQPPPPDDFLFDCGPSQIHGAVKAYGYKRCNKEASCEDVSEKMPKFKEGDGFESTNTNRLLRSTTADSITQKLPTLQIEPTVEDLGNQNVEESETKKINDKYFEDVYHISDTTPQQKSKVPFKKPLPIRITCKNKQQPSCLYTNMKISPAQQEVVKHPENIFQKKPIDEQSAITEFTNDEEKGKKIIMDMFLKSTQVFNDDESISDGRSEATIFEVESDMLLENNVTSKVNGYTKTMSMSVNVKSKQKFKRKKKSGTKISKCVQTTFRTKSVKSVRVKKVEKDTNKAFEAVCGNESPGEYTLVFSNAMDPDKQPKFKCIPRSSEIGCDYMNIDLETFCFCKCHTGKDKLFNFHKDDSQRATVCDNEKTCDQDKLNCGKNKQNEQKGYPEYLWERQRNYQHDSKNDNGSHFNEYPQYDDIDGHAENKYSDPPRLNQQQSNEDSLENHFGENDQHLGIDIRKMPPVNNPDVEKADGNAQYMYGHQCFDPRKYEINILHAPSNNQILQPKGYCHQTCGNIQTYTHNQKHKPKNDTNFRYENACINNVNNLNGLAQLRNYTNVCTKPDYTNFHSKKIVKHSWNFRSNEENDGHVHKNYQQPFPQLNCQDLYGATETYHQSSMHPNKYINAHHRDTVPKLVGCVKTFCHQALPSESPYFKRPQIREKNMFRFVEPKVPKLKKKLNVATAVSPYFSKHDRVVHVETDIYNQQELELRKKQGAEGHASIEKQNVFHCPSEQTLSKDFDIQFFTEHSNSEEKSRDLFGNGDSPHSVFEDNCTINSFKQFRPEYLSTQIQKGDKATDINNQKHVEQLPFQNTCDASNCATKKATRDSAKFFPTSSSELCITLSNNQKQNLLDEELKQDKMFDLKKFEEWISQPAKTNEENVVAKGWIKQGDKCGNFYYINKQTGYATYNTPNQEAENCFKVTERYEFVPKGFSPMLVETEPVDRSLSQNKKDKLLEYIMETYQTDLMYIKWRNYMDDIDPDVFFDNLYKEKVRQYGESIPNIAILQPKDKFRKDQISFNKEMFLNVKVIGQIDRKFICALESKQNLLILFDQHAVHERIRLEKLLIEYKDSKCKSDEIECFLPKNHLKLLVKHDNYLSSLGLTVTYNSNSINITEIPSYIYHKFKDNESLDKVIQLLIKEIVELLRSTRGTTSSSLPKFLQDIISLEACRGAIKFGDILSKEQCTDLLNMLSLCNLPFQCAHGRPTLVPLMHLKMMDRKLYDKQKIHFNNIKSCEL